MNKYFLFISKNRDNYCYMLYDEYREVLFSSSVFSERRYFDLKNFLYKVEIDLILFNLLRKGDFVFKDLKDFVVKYGLEEKIL